MFQANCQRFIDIYLESRKSSIRFPKEITPLFKNSKISKAALFADCFCYTNTHNLILSFGKMVQPASQAMGVSPCFQ